jgi:hypothetical protein
MKHVDAYRNDYKISGYLFSIIPPADVYCFDIVICAGFLVQSTNYFLSADGNELEFLSFTA